MLDITAQDNLDESLIQSLDELCKQGRYLDALAAAQDEWGQMAQWQHEQQILLAIRLMMNLGGDRNSDALLLKHWRKDRQNPHYLIRVIYYQLNKFGPIIAKAFADEHEASILKAPALEPELLAFKAIIQRLFNNYSKAELLLNQALEITDDDPWLITQKVQLLHAQNDGESALALAQEHLQSHTNPGNVRLLAGITLKLNGHQAAVEIYQQYLEHFQSSSFYLELAGLLASGHRWDDCALALERFLQVKRFDDKREQRQYRTLCAQVAIHSDHLAQARAHLAQENSGYWRIVKDNLEVAQQGQIRKVLDVPFLRQEHMTCAPTTLAALCQYWGDNHESKDIADQICFDGTPETKERQWLRDHGYVFKEFDLTASLAHQLLDRDIPFALVTTSGYSSHIQAVIGYNKQVGTLYLMDPSALTMQEILTKETIECESYSGPRCIVYVPSNKASLLDEMHFPEAPLYALWDKLVIAQEQADYMTVLELVDALKKVDAEHRITLRAERSLALWNSDLAKVKGLNDTLLARYPNEATLLNSQYYCLRDLGQRQQGLSLLQESVNSQVNLDLLGTLFDEIYDGQEHDSLKQYALKMLRRYGGYSAYSHWSLANYYWSIQQFELATEHYLFAYCLDETNASYVESYFKASRYLNREDEALAFLRTRFEKYRRRSHLPAVSLHKAYELLGQEHIGIDYLFESLALHPSNSQLLIYLGGVLIDNGLMQRFEQIEPALVQYLDANLVAELMARKNQKQGEFEPALAYYQSAFEQSPYVQGNANRLFSLLHKVRGPEAVDQVLNNLYQDNPNNTRILEYIGDWHSDRVFKEKVLTHFIELRPDFSDVRRQLMDIRINLGRYDLALALAQDTCERIVGDNLNTAYLAKCLARAGELGQAISVAQEALSVSIDNYVAASVLFEASISNQQKRDALTFMFAQMQQQVVFGDALWTYWGEAKHILSGEELFAFIEYMQQQQPHLWYTYSLSAQYYQHLEQLAVASDWLQKGIDKFPLTPRLYHDLGQLRELQGDIELSIQAYRQALELNPAWVEVTKRLSDLLDKHNRTQEAVTVLKAGLVHNPDDGVLYGYLANLYMREDDSQAVIDTLTEAVKRHDDYRWAWDHLISYCRQLGQDNRPYKLACELADKTPYLPQVWRNLAYVASEPADKLAYFQKSLARNPRFIPTYQDHVEFLVNSGDYKGALAVLDQSPWQSKLPFELHTLKAEILTNIGEYQQAIEVLEECLLSTQGNAYWWRKLFNLYLHVQNKKRYIKMCKLSIERNPHAADVLVLAGENLLKHSQERALAIQTLGRAYALASNDQYTVLTYVDCLLDNKQWEEALTALTRFESYGQLSYVTSRKVAALCKLGRFDEGLSEYQKVLQDQQAVHWCLEYGFDALTANFSSEVLLDLFHQSLTSLTQVQSFFYHQRWLASVKPKKHNDIIKAVNEYSEADYSIGAIGALIHYWGDNKRAPLKKFVGTHFDLICSNPWLIERLIYCYSQSGEYREHLKVYANAKALGDVAPFVNYEFAFSLLLEGRWDDAADMCVAGLHKQPDYSVHSLRLWHYYLAFRRGEVIQSSDLSFIDRGGLSVIEIYLHSVLWVAAELGNEPLEQKRPSLDPMLRQCQSDYQPVNGNKLALDGQKLLKKRLKSAVQSTGLWAKLKLAFWINHRF